MKNLFLYTVLLISGLFFVTSCEKEEIGGTATESMAGEWYVTGVAVDADGNIVYSDDDLFGLGHFHLDTYNTSANNTTEMWIDDNENFWDFKAKISVDLNTMTFQASDAQNEYYDMQVTVSDGKIMLGAATTPSGMPADSIVFLVNFSDDTYPEDFGFDSYRIAGFRYTGLTGDE
ncbi:lipid-binding protein [uncultured Sunxiuqinia sp.]|uniref:lipid-binding protein n=1 Tax=uncultured Sunxiuqinia sp. TaxID=1573825 RepID=UPI0030DD1CA9|tara:strand:+ start:44041 stop:44565 length:525 start_codon:yes stop_codon:yes gene_type:complete